MNCRSPGAGRRGRCRVRRRCGRWGRVDALVGCVDRRTEVGVVEPTRRGVVQTGVVNRRGRAGGLRRRRHGRCRRHFRSRGRGCRLRLRHWGARLLDQIGRLVLTGAPSTGSSSLGGDGFWELPAAPGRSLVAARGRGRRRHPQEGWASVAGHAASRLLTVGRPARRRARPGARKRRAGRWKHASRSRGLRLHALKAGGRPDPARGSRHGGSVGPLLASSRGSGSRRRTRQSISPRSSAGLCIRRTRRPRWRRRAPGAHAGKVT